MNKKFIYVFNVSSVFNAKENHQNSTILSINIALLDFNFNFLKFVFLNNHNDKHNKENSKEIDIVNEFISSIKNYQPQIVCFDKSMEILKIKALKYNIESKNLFNNSFFNLNSFCDDFYMLCSDFGLYFYELDNEQLINLYNSKKFDKINEYYTINIVNTLILFYKFQVCNDKMTKENYLNNLLAIQNFLTQNKTNQNYVDFYNQFYVKQLKFNMLL